MTEHYPKLKKAFELEVRRHITGITLKEIPEDDGMIDERFSEKGKEDAILKMKDELNKMNNENRENLKTLIDEFCKEMKLNLHDDDEKDHAAEVANALKVIEMVGVSEITADAVSSLIKPFQPQPFPRLQKGRGWETGDRPGGSGHREAHLRGVHGRQKFPADQARA